MMLRVDHIGRTLVPASVCFLVPEQNPEAQNPRLGTFRLKHFIFVDLDTDRGIVCVRCAR